MKRAPIFQFDPAVDISVDSMFAYSLTDMIHKQYEKISEFNIEMIV